MFHPAAASAAQLSWGELCVLRCFGLRLSAFLRLVAFFRAAMSGGSRGRTRVKSCGGGSHSTRWVPRVAYLSWRLVLTVFEGAKSGSDERDSSESFDALRLFFFFSSSSCGDKNDFQMAAAAGLCTWFSSHMNSALNSKNVPSVRLQLPVMTSAL